MSKMTLYPAFGSTNRYDNYTHYHICYYTYTKNNLLTFTLLYLNFDLFFLLPYLLSFPAENLEVNFVLLKDIFERNPIQYPRILLGFSSFSCNKQFCVFIEICRMPFLSVF